MEPVSRQLGIGVLAVAALVSLAPPASAQDDCVDGYLARCTQPGLSRPVSPPLVSRPIGQVPRVQGLPCTGAHLGACIALTQGAPGSP
jgi:hypothetical protein